MENLKENKQLAEEIDLYELILILKKRKRIILFLTLFSFLISVCLVFFIIKPKYKIGALVKPSVVTFNKDGVPVYDWNAQDLKNWIESKAYLNYLYSKFGIETDIPEVYVHSQRGGKVIEVYLYHYDPDQGKIFMKEILHKFSDIRNKSNIVLIEGEKIKSELQNLNTRKINLNSRIETINDNIESLKEKLKVIDGRKKKLKMQIEDLENRINKIENDIRILTKSIKTIESTKNRLEKKLNYINSNTENLIKSRLNIIKSKSNIDPVEMLLFSNIIQDNLAYASNLDLRIMSLEENILKKQNSIQSKKLEIRAIKNEIKKLQITINTDIAKEEKEVAFKIKKLEMERDVLIPAKLKDIDSKIEELKARLNFLSPIEIVQNVYSSPKPVKPKKLVVILVSTISGLFIGIFLAFFKEFWDQRTLEGKESN